MCTECPPTFLLCVYVGLLLHTYTGCVCVCACSIRMGTFVQMECWCLDGICHATLDNHDKWVIIHQSSFIDKIWWEKAGDGGNAWRDGRRVTRRGFREKQWSLIVNLGKHSNVFPAHQGKWMEYVKLNKDLNTKQQQIWGWGRLHIHRTMSSSSVVFLADAVEYLRANFSMDITFSATIKGNMCAASDSIRLVFSRMTKKPFFTEWVSSQHLMTAWNRQFGQYFWREICLKWS